MIPSKEDLRIQRCIFLIKKGYTYNPETGKIYSNKGTEITCTDAAGYSRITISVTGKKNEYLKGHHFAWYYMYNTIVEVVDHINGIKNDNRSINLRESDWVKNQWNQKNRKGYYWNKKLEKWVAQIQVKKKLLYLGLFEKEEKAEEAYLKAKKEHHCLT